MFGFGVQAINSAPLQFCSKTWLCGAAMQLTESPPEDPLQLMRTRVQQQTAIIAHTARYYSGMPFQARAAASLSKSLGPCSPAAWP